MTAVPARPVATLGGVLMYAGLVLGLGLALGPPVHAGAGTGPICTDRPTRANGVCTVPAGRVQLEADVLAYTRDAQAGVITTSTVVTAAVVKYGIDARSDLELGATAWLDNERTQGGRTARSDGVGDVLLRYKRRVSADDAVLGVSLIPYLKLPTAPASVGNERLEGGLIMPLGAALPGGVALTLGPEIGILAESDGSGTRVNITNLVNLSRSFGRLTLYGELWSANDIAAERDGDQSAADVAASWLVSNDFQLDAGANFGLDADTPDYQVYVGVSGRF
ncbi:MAG: transporter [Gammaproteobacteria bacterium]